MNETTVTLELARKIIAAYEAFDGGKIQVINQLSWENFKKLLSLVGQELNTRSIEETVSLLRRLASEQEEILTAQLPANLAEIVKNYEKWEELRREAEQNPTIIPSLQVQAALLTRGLEQQETILPSEKESLESWKKQEKDIKIQKVLAEVGLEGEEVAPKLKGPLTSLQIREVLKQVGVPENAIESVVEKIQEAGGVPVYTPIPVGTLKPVKAPAPAETSTTPKEEPKKEPVSEIQKLILLYGPRRRSFVGGVFKGLRSVVTGVESPKDENLRPLVEAGIGRRELEQAIEQLQREFPGKLPSDNIYLLYLRDVLEHLPQVQNPAKDVRLVPSGKVDQSSLKNFFLFETNQEGKIVIRQGRGVTAWPVHPPSVSIRPAKNLLSSLQIKARRFLESEKNIGFRFSLSGILTLIGFLPGVPAPIRLLSLTSGVGLGGITALHPKTNIAGRLGNLLASAGSRISTFGRLLALAPAGEGALVFLVIAGALALVLGLVVFVGVPSYHSAFLEEVSAAPDTSRFIEVSKTATPTEHKGSLPVVVKYKVTVTAKGKDLSNIEVGESFSTYSSQGNPSPPASRLPVLPSSLVAGESAEVEYSVVLGPEFNNSIVTNTVTVSADVETDEGAQRETTIRSASVQIGDVPTACFVFVGPWKQTEKGHYVNAIGQLSRSPYLAKLCEGGSIRLIANNSRVGYGGLAEGYLRKITIYPAGRGSLFGAKYTLAHESGHVYDKFNDFIFQDFKVEVWNKKLPLSTYNCVTGFATSDREDFAEMIADYVSWKEFGRCRINMPSQYPLHYNFAKETIFGGVEY